MSNNKLFSYEKDARLIVDDIDDDSKRILERFYTNYSVSSRPPVCSTIRRICKLTKKNSFAKLTYDDYSELENNKTINKNYRNIFFKYLYVYELLNDVSGFEKCYWNKEKEKNSFEKNIQENTEHTRTKNNTKQNSKESLSFEDMEKLFNFYDSVQDDDEENMKLLFFFYAIFYLNMQIEEIRNLKYDQIEDGFIITENNDYELNSRFEAFLSKPSSSNIPFASINDYINKLGKIVGIKDLIPRKIKNTIERYSIKCPVCQETHLNFVDEWRTINNKIVCLKCYEKLISDNSVKKNEITHQIEGAIIDFLSEEEHDSIELTLSTFDKIKENINVPKNYEEINKYLKQIGDLGEKYVVEYEKNFLKSNNSQYYDLVDGSYALDNNNGFDILSYTLKGKKVYIEVKTTTGNPKDSFYMSKHEIDTAKELIKRGEIYRLYRVGNILSNNVSLIIYDDLNQFNEDEIILKMSIKE